MQPEYSNNLHLFIGPTLSGFENKMPGLLDQARWHPPVKRNDIRNLLRTHPPSVIVLVDGYFHNCLAVGHKEIREAIRGGWVIWGISSMGAIRASEMIRLGMKGYGLVYNHFLEDPDFRDDEVSMLHGKEKPYTLISEPLIHIRYSLDHLLKTKQVTLQEKNKIVGILASNWYGDRTLFFLKELLKNETKFNDEVPLDNFLAGFDQFRVKSADFVNFMTRKIWESAK